jgi:hypothetical protein
LGTWNPRRCPDFTAEVRPIGLRIPRTWPNVAYRYRYLYLCGPARVVILAGDLAIRCADLDSVAENALTISLGGSVSRNAEPLFNRLDQSPRGRPVDLPGQLGENFRNRQAKRKNLGRSESLRTADPKADGKT